MKHILDFIEKHLDYIENTQSEEKSPAMLFFEREALVRIGRKCFDILMKVENSPWDPR